MPSPPDEFRRLLREFSPQSRDYWVEVGRTLFGAVPEGHQQHLRTAYGRARGTATTAWELLVSHLAPVVECVRLERQLRPEIERGKEDYEIPEHAAAYLALSKEELKDSLKIELGRKEQFNRKAQAYLMGVTLATSFAVGLLGVYAKGGGAMPPGLKAVLVAVVVSLVMSAAGALRVIAPSMAFDLYLQNRLVEAVDVRDGFERRQLLKLTLLNQGHNLIAVTYLTASFRGMRNGLVLVTGVLIWAILAA
jgi:hypothetical protein